MTTNRIFRTSSPPIQLISPRQGAVIATPSSLATPPPLTSTNTPSVGPSINHFLIGGIAGALIIVCLLGYTCVALRFKWRPFWRQDKGDACSTEAGTRDKPRNTGDMGRSATVSSPQLTSYQSTHMPQNSMESFHVTRSGVTATSNSSRSHYPPVEFSNCK